MFRGPSVLWTYCSGGIVIREHGNLWCFPFFAEHIFDFRLLHCLMPCKDYSLGCYQHLKYYPVQVFGPHSSQSRMSSSDWAQRHPCRPHCQALCWCFINPNWPWRECKCDNSLDIGTLRSACIAYLQTAVYLPWCRVLGGK